MGGCGGSGGMSLSGNLTLASDSTGVALAIGGSGGSRGSSTVNPGQNTVQVLNQTAIQTVGEQSQGILAQSIGGGGGSGGTSITGNLSTSSATNFGLSIGGAGTNGGSGATVVVDNTQSISTGGNLSEGILHQKQWRRRRQWRNERQQLGHFVRRHHLQPVAGWCWFGWRNRQPGVDHQYRGDQHQRRPI